jgi:hypothetical protein
LLQIWRIAGAVSIGRHPRRFAQRIPLPDQRRSQVLEPLSGSKRIFNFAEGAEGGEDARDFPIYCQRLSFFPEVPEHEAVAELFLPLK